MVKPLIVYRAEPGAREVLGMDDNQAMQERAWTDLEVLVQGVLSKEKREVQKSYWLILCVSIEEMLRCQQPSQIRACTLLPNHLMWGL